MTGSEDSPAFRLAYVPGVTPSKWVRIWNERLPHIPLTLNQVPAAEVCEALRRGEADAGFVRLPVDGDDLSAIPLYEETTVVVIPKDHLFAAADEVAVTDLAEEVVLHPLDDTLAWEQPPGRPAVGRPATTADAVELVAAGIGVLIVPQSLARLHHRRDLTYRTITDVPTSRVALSWPQEATTDLVEDLIGIVRGRTVNSTRGRRTEPEPKAKRPEKGATRRQQPPGGRGAGRTAGKPSAKNARRGSGGAKGGKPRRRP
ncbi:LysR family substrate-binding domain-containing protein [Streptomyces sp. AC536]|uniref:LysR family substrate-binding domain-containing protein n=1 Tax=Streptomyces buecherae TaxID=2763006 RepID=UPI00164D208C|nr:LysR family substrate-binding domain-containing protein [Streptomyces buecherae]MBC3986720.1 LysR family substrate-binding domain-containing protein [Streptomyces buecherae]QNJ43648.1 LysR family substrate-binding domain-containing protein [Streptomyces buecherae]